MFTIIKRNIKFLRIAKNMFINYKYNSFLKIKIKFNIKID